MRLAWWGILGLSVLPLTASGQPEIVNLGVLPNGRASSPYAVSVDGTFVAGYVGAIQDQYSRAFRWSQTTGMQDLGATGPEPGSSSAQAMSADGLAVGGSIYSWAMIWTEAAGLRSLGPLPGGAVSSGNALSADGTTLVGNVSWPAPSNSHGFRWTEAIGTQDLGVPIGFLWSSARGVSADGCTIVGAAGGTGPPGDGGRIAMRWTLSSGFTALGVLPGAEISEAHGVSADGLVVVGESGTGSEIQAVRWSTSEGMLGLGILPGGSQSNAYAVSADGSTVVGVSQVVTGHHAFIWSQSLGMMDLHDYLASEGVDLSGWVLEQATAISGDGSAIVGRGFYQGQVRGWLARGLNLGLCPSMLVAPRNSATCANGTVLVSLLAGGSGTLAYEWQVRPGSSPDAWVNIVEGQNALPGAGNALVIGAATRQPTWKFFDGSNAGEAFILRCVVSNACGSVTSNVATLAVSQCDCVDFNRDDIYPDTQDLLDMLNVFGGGACSNDPGCADVDFNNDEIYPDIADLELFLFVFGGGAC